MVLPRYQRVSMSEHECITKDVVIADQVEEGPLANVGKFQKQRKHTSEDHQYPSTSSTSMESASIIHPV